VSSRSGEASANCYTPLYFTLLPVLCKSIMTDESTSTRPIHFLCHFDTYFLQDETRNAQSTLMERMSATRHVYKGSFTHLLNRQTMYHSHWHCRWNNASLVDLHELIIRLGIVSASVQLSTITSELTDLLPHLYICHVVRVISIIPLLLHS